MLDAGGLPYCEIEFTKAAALVDPTATEETAHLVHTRNIRNLLVVSHGWNNDIAEARKLYANLLAWIASVVPIVTPLAGGQIGVVAVLWPSKRYADDDLIPGGSASLSSPGHPIVLETMIDKLMGTFDAPDADLKLQRAKSLVARLETDATARREFADLVRAVISGVDRADVDASECFFARDGDDLLRLLSTTGADDQLAPPGGATDGDRLETVAPVARGRRTADLTDFFGGIIAAARNLLNYTTYYQMKQRAGLIGETGLNPMVRFLRARFPQLRIHLVGHSFGARVVTATAFGQASPDGMVCDTLTLLQAAFSHYAFAKDFEPGKDGFFRKVVAGNPPRLRGPVVITCTRNDRTVGIAYAIASRLAGQVASLLGDQNDKYGGLGRNGAQKTPETAAGTLLAVNGNYDGFAGNKLFNLNADTVIADHSDICRPEIAYLILSVMAAMQG